MAKPSETFEPAFAYSIVFTIASLTLIPFGLSGLVAADPTGLGAAQIGLMSAYWLLTLGLVGAMAEPLPRDPGDGPPGLRLRVCWGILGLCPPPGRTVRLLLTAAAFFLLASPFAELSADSVMVAAAFSATAFTLGRPKDILNMDLAESAFLIATTLAGVWAVYVSVAEVEGTAWRGLSGLASIALLHAQRARELTALRWARVLPGVRPPPALDLSRYELKVERAVEAPALAPGVEEVLVDTGSFRVDAAKMLDKLRGFQLADPQDFIVAWLRCAAASGATRILLTKNAAGVTLRFDGRAFSPAELSQPYQVLVDGEGENARRGRHFAYGLLALYRLTPESVRVVSRGPQGVAMMTAGRGPAADAYGAEEGTVIRVDWPLGGLFWRPWLTARRARERYGLGPAALSIDGSAVPDHPEGGRWRSSLHREQRSWWRSSTFLRRTRVYVLGTWIEDIEDSALAAEAWLADDELELDISQSSVVRGDRLAEAFERLQREVAGRT